MKPFWKAFIIPTLSASFFVIGSTVQAQPKLLSNADVVSMLKAGLTESNIILSIQQAPAKFDTSSQSLIQLKQQGVSSKILDAILKKQPGSNANTVAVATNVSEGVQMIVDGQPVAIKRSKVQVRVSGGLFQSLTGIGDVKSRAVLEGNRAKLRLNNNQQVFQVVLPADVDPEDYVNIVKLQVKGDRRQTVVSRAGFSFSDGARAKDGFDQKDIVSLNFEDTGVRTASGKIVYTVKPFNQLELGEYALIHTLSFEASEQDESDLKRNYYDFGIDA
ncbi:MAG: hypothetical protein HC934_14110 [Acaryochloridaceae cyanobacterium SU_2_1]|nr:hypothetical protein [Acaryochloridaceae cyanobacterium SU_2_1]